MKCSNCDSIFRNKFLAEHRKSHLNAEGNLPCPQCEKSCPNYTEMAKHMHAIHNVGPIYECMQCDWKNKNKQLYNKHMNTAHVDKSDKKFICDQVCLSFQRKKVGVVSKMYTRSKITTLSNVFLHQICKHRKHHNLIKTSMWIFISVV